MHGYHLAEELHTRRYVREGRFKTGSLYTILNRMENKEIITSTHEESESGRPMRVYSITEDGRLHLKNGLQSFETIQTRVMCQIKVQGSHRDIPIGHYMEI